MRPSKPRQRASALTDASAADRPPADARRSPTTRAGGGGSASSTLLPAAHLSPTPLLGHTREARSTLAQLLATQVGHVLIERGGGGPAGGPGGLPGAGGAAGAGGGGAGGPGGMLVMGVGLRNESVDREEFAALVGGVLDCVG